MGYQTDNFYIHKVLNGDTRAFASLVDKHKDMVFTICNKITRSREDAEEIAQDTFLKAYEHLSNFKKLSKFSTWLYRIAYNSAISKVRKRTLETQPLDDNITDQFTEDNISLEIHEKSEKEQKKLIEKALNTLKEQDYLIITMFYLKEKSVDDISEITGLSKSNIKVRLHRLRKKIYHELYQMVGENVNLFVL